MKVLVTDPLAEAGLEILRQQAEVTVATDLSPAALRQTIVGYDALVVRSGTEVTADVIAAGTRLRAVGRAGVGINNIDVSAATAAGVMVINVPDGNTISAAEHTLGMLIALARNIPAAHGKLRQGDWDRKAFMGSELYGKTAGIIGLGRIGMEVASRLQGFEVEVQAFDPFISRERAEQAGIKLVQLPELYATSDIITIHTPLTDDTYHLIDAEALAEMRPGVRLVNCARGGIIDEAALYDALTEGRVAGAALDVFEEEPPQNLALLQLDNVVVTPHLGASTYEAQDYNAVAIARQILAALDGEPVANAVNLPRIPPEEWQQIEPFVPLAQLLGSFYSQAFPGRLAEVKVHYQGNVARVPTTLLTNAVVSGLLADIVSEPINLVNAPIIAERRGIQVVESKNPQRRDYASLITLHGSANGRTMSVSGTLSPTGNPRLVELDGYRVELTPSRNMLLTRHTDKPGIIGRVGTLLGNHGINIAGMQVGRRTLRGEAVMVLKVDEEIDADLLQKLEAIDGMGQLHYVQLRSLEPGGTS